MPENSSGIVVVHFEASVFRMDSDGSDEAHHSDPAQDPTTYRETRLSKFLSFVKSCSSTFACRFQ